MDVEFQVLSSIYLEAGVLFCGLCSEEIIGQTEGILREARRLVE